MWGKRIAAPAIPDCTIIPFSAYCVEEGVVGSAVFCFYHHPLLDILVGRKPETTASKKFRHIYQPYTYAL